MINNTSDIIILNEDKLLDCVDKFTKAFIDKGIVTKGKKRELTKPYKDYKSLFMIHQGAFAHYLMPILKGITVTRVQELYQITLITKVDTDKQQKIESILDCEFHHKKAASGIHEACISMFIWLWKHKVALLSGNFKFIKYYCLADSIVVETYDKLLEINAPFDQTKGKLRADYRIWQSSLYFIFLTDWYSWAEVSLLEFWERLLFSSIATVRDGTHPKLLFDIAAGNGASYTQKDVTNVFSRVGLHSAVLADPLIKLDTLELLDEYIKGVVGDGKNLQVSIKKNQANLQRMKNKVRNAHFGGSINDSIKFDVDSMSVSDKLTHYAKHDDMDNYLKNLSKLRKNHNNLPYLFKGFYPGINIDPRAEFPQWCYVIEAYMSGPKAPTRSCKMFISYLVDYLFVYLVAFYDSNPDAVHVLPRKIKDFSRIIFWEQTILPQEMKANAPKTLSDFIAERAPSTAGMMVNLARKFFEFILTNYSVAHPEVPDVPVLSDFVNPINIATDSGKWRHPKAPTNKIAMPIETLPFVHNTLRVLSEAHNKLQKLFLKEKNASKRLEYSKQNSVFKLSDWGIEDCSFELNGQIVSFDEVPNLFIWELGRGNYPALSCFRMLRTNVHAGQRLENIQWLDINNFDQLGKVDGYFQPLWIDIDKIFEDRIAKIPTYIFDELVAERHYQRKYGLEIIPFKHNTSDKLISPLFRSNAAQGKGGPVTDETYRKMWIDILWFIQQHYNEFVPPSKRHSFVRLVPYKDSTGKNANIHQWNMGDPIVDSEGVLRNGNATALQTLAVHTPHSMRNTYTVARKGLISYQDLMVQQGWTSEVTMHHYLQAMHQNDTDKLLELADKSIMDGTYSIKESNSDALFLLGNNTIRPSKSDSAMTESLAAGADAIIHDQGLISIRTPELDAYKGEDGLKMLIAQQRAIKPVIFDHCLCPAGGDCPKEIVEIIGEKNRCGICPIACYGIDNISGLNARITEKREAARKGLIMLKRLEARNENQSVTTPIKEQIELNQSEVGSMRMTANLLKKKLESGELERYLCRHPDMVKNVVQISINTTDERNLFISKLIEAQAHPQYCSENFVDQCQSYFNRTNRKMHKDDESDIIQVVAGHFSAIMREKNIDFEQLLSSPEFLQISKEL